MDWPWTVDRVNLEGKGGGRTTVLTGTIIRAPLLRRKRHSAVLLPSTPSICARDAIHREGNFNAIYILIK